MVSYVSMSMFWAEQQLRSSGEPQDEAYANVLAAIIAARGDIDLPTALPEEQQSYPDSEAAIDCDDPWRLNEFSLPEEMDSFFLSTSSRIGALSVESEVEKNDAGSTIRAGAESLVEPFTIAFGELLPVAKSRRRKEKIVVPVHMDETLNRNGHLVPHHYKVTYRDEDQHTFLESVRLSFGNSEARNLPQEDNPSLSFKYNQSGDPTSIDLRWGSPTLLLPNLMPKPLKEFTLRSFGQSSDEDGAVDGEVVFHWNMATSSRLGFIIGEQPSLIIQGPNQNVVYSLGANNPKVLERSIVSDEVRKMKNGEDLPPEISVDQFLGMLHQTLQLVPTISDIKLLGNK